MLYVMHTIVICLISFFFAQVSLGAGQQKTSEYENQLFFTPGGKYTADDIVANGNTTPSQKFKKDISPHDMQVQKGDFICPITSIKASPVYTWIIGGKTYQFCCPACIDEFLTLAKQSPHQIKDPEHYVK